MLPLGDGRGRERSREALRSVRAFERGRFRSSPFGSPLRREDQCNVGCCSKKEKTIKTAIECDSPQRRPPARAISVRL